MWYQLWIPILIPTLIIKSNCDTNKTDTNVFIRAGHADLEYQTNTPKTTTLKTITVRETDTTTAFVEEITENVVFIPNDKPEIERDDGYDEGVRIKDVMMLKTVNDALNDNFNAETPVSDAPESDTIFVSGKNREIDKNIQENTRRKAKHYENHIEEEKDVGNLKPKLDCSNLECNNLIKSVCGAKIINNEWKYRLFLNECYFRKVNCGLKYEVNRYQQVELEKCSSIGSHNVERPFHFNPRPLNLNKEDPNVELNARRMLSSRRAMTMDYYGQICSHPCPTSCHEDYDPQCAVSGTGQRRVFINHCRLDHNSCSFGVVWHKRPLSECVGGKKAEMRQNRGFIGWMQRVGIVDRRGRLVLQ